MDDDKNWWVGLRTETLYLEPDEFDEFVRVMQNPPPPTEYMKKAAETARRLWGKKDTDPGF